MKKSVLIAATLLITLANTADAARVCKPMPGANGKYQCKYEKTSFICRQNLKPNGCSAPASLEPNLVPKYNRVFRAACSDHDMCYYFGSTKATCDGRFLAKMQATCARLGNECKAMAKVYYAGVALAPIARTAYSGGQRHRKNRCVGQSVGEQFAGKRKKVVNIGKKTASKARKKVAKAGKKLIGKVDGIFK